MTVRVPSLLAFPSEEGAEEQADNASAVAAAHAAARILFDMKIILWRSENHCQIIPRVRTPSGRGRYFARAVVARTTKSGEKT